MHITLKQIEAAANDLLGYMYEGADEYNALCAARGALVRAFPDADIAPLPGRPTMTVAGMPSIGWIKNWE